MPAQHKYNKYDSKKRYSSSSSSSSYHRKDKDHKNYITDKWRKKSRSRSHSNHRHENKYKISYQKDKDQRRYGNKSYEKRSDGYRRRDSEEDRRRGQQKKNVSRYGFARNDQRDRGYQQHRKEQKRQKQVQSKRYVSSSSKSISKSPKNKSPKNNRDSTNRDSTRYNDNKFIFTKRNDNKASTFQDKADKKQTEQPKLKFQNREKQQIKQQRNENHPKEIESDKITKFIDRPQRDNEERFQIKPKFGILRPPFPPPPPSNYRKFNQEPQRKFEFQPRKEEFKREQVTVKQQKTKQERVQRHQPKRQPPQKPILQPQFPKLTPIRRFNQIKKQLKDELTMMDVAKVKVSRFEMAMNQAKANLLLPVPPTNFMCLDTFKNMNKFQIQALDKRWAHSLKQELQKPIDLKQLIGSLPQVTQQQKKESRLWTYLKEQRNQQQHNLKLKLDQLRLTNMGLGEMVRKLHLLQS